MGDSPELPESPSGRRQFTGRSVERFEDWVAEGHDWLEVEPVIWAIADDTWPDLFPWFPDVARPLEYHLMIAPTLVVTVRYVRDYPGFVQVVYVGAPF